MEVFFFFRRGLNNYLKLQDYNKIKMMMQKQKINIKFLDNLLEGTTLGFHFEYKKYGSHSNVHMLFNNKILEYRFCTFCCNYILLKTKYFKYYHRKNSYGRCCLKCSEKSRLNSAAYRERKRKIGQIIDSI